GVEVAIACRQPASFVDQSLEVEARDHAQGLEIREIAVVDHLHERPPAIEEAEDAVDLVRNLSEPFDQRLVVDLEYRLERRKLLEQPAPLVETAHPLHQEALRREIDHVLATDVLELDLELSVGPDEEPVDGILSLEASELGIDHLAVA